MSSAAARFVIVMQRLACDPWRGRGPNDHTCGPHREAARRLPGTLRRRPRRASRHTVAQPQQLQERPGDELLPCRRTVRARRLADGRRRRRFARRKDQAGAAGCCWIGGTSGSSRRHSGLDSRSRTRASATSARRRSKSRASRSSSTAQPLLDCRPRVAARPGGGVTLADYIEVRYGPNGSYFRQRGPTHFEARRDPPLRAKGQAARRSRSSLTIWMFSA